MTITTQNGKNKQLEEDLKLAEEKKDKALANGKSGKEQIKIGLIYRGDQVSALLKDKFKKTKGKIKDKVYGVKDLLKTKID